MVEMSVPLEEGMLENVLVMVEMVVVLVIEIVERERERFCAGVGVWRGPPGLMERGREDVVVVVRGMKRPVSVWIEEGLNAEVGREVSVWIVRRGVSDVVWDRIRVGR